MRKKKSQNISIIDRDLTLDGTISGKGKLIIKGTLRGAIDGENVVIAKEGSVFSEARVTSMTIGGRFEGELEVSEELIILSSGNCAGKVVCKDLVVESGGLLNAEVTCRSADGMKQEEENPSVVKISAG